MRCARLINDRAFLTEGKQMPTENENANNSRYLIRHIETEDNDIVTYKSNVIKKIKRMISSDENLEIQNFCENSITDSKFERFVSLAKEAGYKIYKITEL